MSMLALIYIGFSYVAAHNSAEISVENKAEILSVIALHTLGSYAGLVASLAVSLACLTTAIALVAVFAEYLHEDIFREKIGYQPSLIITLVLTGYIACFNFMGIAKFLTPLLEVVYPCLIVLSIVNLFYKTHNFKPVKGPVFITFLISLIFHLIK